MVLTRRRREVSEARLGSSFEISPQEVLERMLENVERGHPDNTKTE